MIMRKMTRDEALTLELAVKDLDGAIAGLSPFYAEKARQLALSDIDDETFNDALIALLAEQLVDESCHFATDKIRHAIREEEA